MKFAFIEAHASVYAITTMCRVLEMSRTGYHACVKRPLSERAVEDAAFAVEIQVIHRTSRRTYGSPRVHEELKASGKRHGKDGSHA